MRYILREVHCYAEVETQLVTVDGKLADDAGAADWFVSCGGVGDDVYAQVYMSPSASATGTATIWMYYDEGFLKLASGSDSHNFTGDDITVNEETGFIVTPVPGTQTYKGEGVKCIVFNAQTPAIESETWVATIHFTVARTDASETEGWVRVRPPEIRYGNRYWTN